MMTILQKYMNIWNIDSDSRNTESDSDDKTDIHIVVIPPDSSPLYRPLPLSFTANAGINVIVQSGESIMSFVDLFCTPEFY